MTIDLDQLKAQNPIVDVVQRYGVNIQPSGRGYRALCPFHDDHTPSLYIYPEEGSFKCFGVSCGRHGDVIDFVGLQLHGSEWDKTNRAMFGAALEALGGRQNTSSAAKKRPRRAQATAPPRPKDAALSKTPQHDKPTTPMVLAALDLAARVYHETLIKLGDEAGTPLRYLYDRGFTWKTIRDGQIGYCPSRSELLQVAAELMSVPREALIEAGVLREKRSGRGHYETFYGRITLTDRDFSFRVLHLIGRKFPGDKLPEENSEVPQPARLAQTALRICLPAIPGPRAGHDRRGTAGHAHAAPVGLRRRGRGRGRDEGPACPTPARPRATPGHHPQQ